MGRKNAIVVLDDGETYSGLEECEILVLGDEEMEQLEAGTSLKEIAANSRIKVTELEASHAALMHIIMTQTDICPWGHAQHGRTNCKLGNPGCACADELLDIELKKELGQQATKEAQ